MKAEEKQLINEYLSADEQVLYLQRYLDSIDTITDFSRDDLTLFLVAQAKKEERETYRGICFNLGYYSTYDTISALINTSTLLFPADMFARHEHAVRVITRIIVNNCK